MNVVPASANYVLTGPTTGTLIITPAEAQVMLSDLVQPWTGAPRPVTVTTVPPDVPVLVTYDGNADAPIAVGSYAVVAQISDPNYTASAATGTLQIVPGEPGLIVAVAGDAQSALAGTTLPTAPQVRVTDAGGNATEGAEVVFAIATGGGSVSGATAITDADGLASAGSWTLGQVPGVNTLTVSVTGASVTPLTLTATGTAQVDASITITSQAAYIRPGDIHDHVIVVRNDGATWASDVIIDVPLPQEHNPATANWACLSTGGANCPAASGSGAISVGADLPVDGSLTFLAFARVLASPVSGEITVTGTVSAGHDTDPGNDTATATTPMVLFRNGFEVNSNGANAETGTLVERGKLDSTREPLAVVADERTAYALPGSWLTLKQPDGNALIVLDRFDHQGTAWIRVREVGGEGQHAHAWQPMSNGLGLALVERGEAAMLLIDTGTAIAELPLDVDADEGLRVFERID